MPKALILVADGSEEIEFVTPYDGKSPTAYKPHSPSVARIDAYPVLTRAGFTIHSVGINLKNENYAQ
jgi:protein DJ-1